jgi:hypothetical protein
LSPYSAISFPPLNDVPPVPIALVPVARTYENLAYGLHRSIWRVLFYLPLMLMFMIMVAVIMSVLFSPLVYAGWEMQRRFGASA